MEILATSSAEVANCFKSVFTVVDSQRASRNSLEVGSPAERSPSPQDVELNRASTSSCPDMAGLRVKSQKHYCTVYCESFCL